MEWKLQPGNFVALIFTFKLMIHSGDYASIIGMKIDWVVTKLWRFKIWLIANTFTLTALLWKFCIIWEKSSHFRPSVDSTMTSLCGMVWLLLRVMFVDVSWREVWRPSHRLWLAFCMSNIVHFCQRWCGGRVVRGADSSLLATYGVIHISLGHISAQVHILNISCHLFICIFHFNWYFRWPPCL